MRGWGTLLLLVALATPGQAQRQGLRLAGPDGSVRSLTVEGHRGYAALAASQLAPLGWRVAESSGGWTLAHRDGVVVRLREGSPFFDWDGETLQLTSEPYEIGELLYIPLQLLTDFFPARLPAAYALVEGGGGLTVGDPRHWPGAGPSPGARGPGRAGVDPAARPADPDPAGVEPARAGGGRDELRVVVIDPGHGGRDPGSTGPNGAREKDVALAVARALKAELDRYPGLEVHLTRDSDVLVPLWDRGQLATGVKGERPGVFISIHANALPNQRSARGFETYFLSDARTEHERRVAANENAPLALDREDGARVQDSDLDDILRELRNLDHQHWSALLAEMIQTRVAPMHPGPDRGVKQAPLAVITNALMPAVLVEMGFISNPEEERVLVRSSFQEEMGSALARAVVDFFERYPPGRGTTLERGPGELP